jgi:hypothetical protein
MEPSKRYVIASGEVRRLEERDHEIGLQIVAQRSVSQQIRAANAQAIVDGGVVDSGKLLEANSRLDELESALALIREKNLPAARAEKEAAGHEEAIREVREINQMNESEYNVLIRDTFGYIERLRVIDRRQRRKLELQSTYRGLGGESLMGDMSAASAAGAFQSVLFARLELLTRGRKEGHLSQSQQDEYDRLWDLFYGEVSRANQKAAADLASAQQEHDQLRQAELVSLRPASDLHA